MYKRLRREAAEAAKSTDPDVLLAPGGDTLDEWRAWVKGPEGTPYEGGVFALEISPPPTYPLAPPRVRMATPVFHPNVHGATGEICLDVLKEAWTPAWTLASACTAIRALLAAPNADSPLNCDAGNVLRSGDVAGFEKQARECVEQHARNPMPERTKLPEPEAKKPPAPQDGLGATVLLLAIAVLLAGALYV